MNIVMYSDLGETMEDIETKNLIKYHSEFDICLFQYINNNKIIIIRKIIKIIIILNNQII